MDIKIFDMKKKLTLSLLVVLFFSTYLSAQQKIYLNGIVSKPFAHYHVGDTIPILAKRTNPNTLKPQYLVHVFTEVRAVSEDKITLLDEGHDFWEMVWIENRAENVNKVGWERGRREELHQEALDYYSTALSNKMVFEDDMLYDYLYQMVNLIHPTPLVKERSSNFSIVVLNSTEQIGFAFDNGMIVLTTGMLASTKTEAELLNVLAECVAHVVLEHNLINLNARLKTEARARTWATIAAVTMATAQTIDGINYGYVPDYSVSADLGMSVYFLSTSALEDIGAQYTSEQRIKAQGYGKAFLKQYPEIISLDDYQYTGVIANAISTAAWQEYHLKNYFYAMQLTERLNNLDLATDKDYLLLSRIQRRISNDRYSIQLALDYIQKGKGKSIEPLADLEKEAGIVYSRLNQPDKAKESYMKYREFLLKLKEEGKHVEPELQSIDQLIQRKGYLVGQVATAIEEN